MAMVVFGEVASAQAVWNSASDGNWGTPGNWSTGIVPGASNTTAAQLTNTGGSYAVTYDTPINSVLGSLTITNTGGNTTTLNVDAGNFRSNAGTLANAAINIGASGAMTTGALQSNTASTIVVSGGSYSGSVTFGNSNSASTIHVQMSSGSFALNSSSGNNYGRFTMTGGNATVSGGIFDQVFTSTISGGTYTNTSNNSFSIRGGTLTVSGNGTFNVNRFTIDGQGQQFRVTGGEVNVTGNQFSFGNNNFTGTRTSTGNQTGGTVTMTNSAGLVVGAASNAGLDAASLNLYQLSGGTLNLQRITLAAGAYLGPGTNRFAMSGGTLNLGSGGLLVGSGNGTKQFQFSGGTVGAQANNWSSSAAISLLATPGSGTTTFRASDTDDIARNITLSGALSGNGSLAKTGDGILTLSGNNTYSGTTTVSAGTLLVDGVHTGGGLYTIASGATLGGTGSISGNVSIAGDATFWVDDLNDPTGLGVTGGTVSFTSAGGGFGINRLENIDWNTIDLGTYTLISGNVSFANVDTSPVEVRAGVFASLASGSMQLVVVPEPDTLALGVIGMVGLCFCARRSWKR